MKLYSKILLERIEIWFKIFMIFGIYGCHNFLENISFNSTFFFLFSFNNIRWICSYAIWKRFLVNKGFFEFSISFSRIAWERERVKILKQHAAVTVNLQHGLSNKLSHRLPNKMCMKHVTDLKSPRDINGKTHSKMMMH